MESGFICTADAGRRTGISAETTVQPAGTAAELWFVRAAAVSAASVWCTGTAAELLWFVRAAAISATAVQRTGQQQNYGPAGQQSYQQPPYGQPGQQSTPYDSPMGYVGYEYRQNVPVDVKKGSTHIPNLLNIVGMIMALITVFLPYAHMDSDVRTISGVFGIDVISVIVVAVLLVADIISAFMNKTVAYIIDLVISVIIGGALIFEFVLSLIDLGRLDKTVNAGLGFGAWFSVVTAILLLVSVPVWWAVSRKKAKSEKETAESAV